MMSVITVIRNGDTPRVLGTEKVAVTKTDSAEELTKLTVWE